MSALEMFAAIVAACCLWAAPARAAGVRPVPVDVPRCCPRGLELDPEALRLDLLPRARALLACRPAAAVWAPRVYAPARGKYLDPGQLPAHWRPVDAALPACDELRVLPDHSAPYALLANNASLLARSPAAAVVPPARYCADAAAALVCAEDAPRAGASKCCAETEAFDGARCVEDEAPAAVALGELRAIAAAAGLRVGLGWPACAAGSRYAVAGALAAATLAADGALALGAERLPPGAWCAEAVPADAAGASVLACEAAARAPAGAARPVRHALYGAGLAVGAAFLAATLAAGFAMPAAHHALHWRCQTYYVAALMVGDALLAATQLAADAVPAPLCRALGECRRVRPSGLVGARGARRGSSRRFRCCMCGRQLWRCTFCSCLPSSG